MAVTARRGALLRPARSAADACCAPRRRGARALGHARLRDFHAQGDPRAARRGGGDARGRARERTESRCPTSASTTSSSGAWTGSRSSAAAPPTTRAARPVRDPAVGRCPGRLRHRIRVPLRASRGSAPGDLLIGITQSGETADTLAALRMARARGARTVALTNVQGSLATRESDGTLLTRAGNEVGVAATKTFVCQVAALYLLALRLAEVRRRYPVRSSSGCGASWRELPRRLREVLAAATARPDPGDRRAVRPGRVLPLHGPPGRPAGRARGCAEAEGDLLHPLRRLRGRAR